MAIQAWHIAQLNGQIHLLLDSGITPWGCSRVREPPRQDAETMTTDRMTELLAALGQAHECLEERTSDGRLAGSTHDGIAANYNNRNKSNKSMVETRPQGELECAPAPAPTPAPAPASAKLSSSVDELAVTEKSDLSNHVLKPSTNTLDVKTVTQNLKLVLADKVQLKTLTQELKYLAHSDGTENFARRWATLLDGAANTINAPRGRDLHGAGRWHARLEQCWTNAPKKLAPRVPFKHDFESFDKPIDVPTLATCKTHGTIVTIPLGSWCFVVRYHAIKFQNVSIDSCMACFVCARCANASVSDLLNFGIETIDRNGLHGRVLLRELLGRGTAPHATNTHALADKSTLIKDRRHR
jgi:hypothetical protein